MWLKFIYQQSATDSFSIRQLLAVSILFSCFLLGCRIYSTGELHYTFLVWNLFLALIPYAITQFLYAHPTWVIHRFRFVVLLFIWLLFIPNSFYIITDLFHLDRFGGAPQWFDLLLIFSFAWNGIVLGILSLRQIEWLLLLRYRKSFSLLFITLVMALNALGIYIGRYLRYNSWDIIVQPGTLLGDIIYLLRHPLQNKMEWGMIGTYTLFMTLFYITLQKVAEQFNHTTKHN